MSDVISAAPPRVPVTLVTGFLGAGKTTLINAVLRQNATPKVAVIVNEFGEAGLDHDLIEIVDENVMLLASGCICCSVRGELSQTMAALFERHKTGRISFDRVVIETTGLAAPGPILQTLTTDPFLANAVSLDGIVTVADAVVGSGTLDREFEAVSQVALADLVVLSKSDVAAPQDLRMFEARLRSLNPTAQIVRANHGDVPLNSLWGLSGFRSDATPASAEIWLAPRAAASGHELLATFSGLQPVIAPQTMTQTPHDTRIGSASIILDEPIPEEAFDLWLDTLIALRGADILRVKGIVHIEGIETPFVFHGVQHVFDRPVPLRDWPSDAHRSRIVVIARDLTQRELSRSLDMLRRPDPTAAPEADAHPRMSAPKTRPRA